MQHVVNYIDKVYQRRLLISHRCQTRLYDSATCTATEQRSSHALQFNTIIIIIFTTIRERV